MKKASTYICIVGLAVSLMGCSVPVPVAESETVAAPSSSIVASEAPTSSVEPTKGNETDESSSSEPARASSSAGAGGAASQPAASGNQAGGGSSQSPPSASPQAPAASQPPASSQPQTPPASSQPPAQPAPQTPPPQADPPAPATAYDAPYDTGAILADAQSYGASLGMTWSDGLNKDNCSWEAPIQTSSVLCGDRLKEAIQSGIRRVQRLQQDNGYQPGEFHFKLHLEAGGGEYSLYFLMG